MLGSLVVRSLSTNLSFAASNLLYCLLYGLLYPGLTSFVRCVLSFLRVFIRVLGCTVLPHAVREKVSLLYILLLCRSYEYCSGVWPGQVLFACENTWLC